MEDVDAGRVPGQAGSEDGQDVSPEEVLEKCAGRLEAEVPREEEKSTLYLALGVRSGKGNLQRE